MLSNKQQNDVKLILDRNPTKAELAVYDAMWSEHCSYKSSKPLLKHLYTKNKHVIHIKQDKNKVIKIYGKKYLNNFNLSVPGDPSSAAFFTALTILNKNSSIKIKNVGLNPTRIGFFNLLKNQGAKLNFSNFKKKNNEIRGDIVVKSCKLKPIKANAKRYPSMPDEYPISFIVAALTPGVHVFKGISDLSNKESSRAYEIKKILKQVGVRCKLTKNEIFTILSG